MFCEQGEGRAGSNSRSGCWGANIQPARALVQIAILKHKLTNLFLLNWFVYRPPTFLFQVERHETKLFAPEPYQIGKVTYKDELPIDIRPMAVAETLAPLGASKGL
jgi:hypothetical protein